ncbi:hypothetical protein [Nostoc sp. 'Peltigera membranacea cyanobiont' 232]|jgi:hypothetical protein|uniref:hypothetical protein n=1 Tax=Nostoc sp. 'Peltigera membranacea cyanobiont' 232 TaxID=2014531 RepID=UPI000B9552CB|nr:hypothetical protein [Nostoc sp. 'Peltigera membranacea cyanobiont' 232]OYE02805.1 hypothetical protein CDG79_22020 [Nostoc sp. 'Peltigera membranacea cyanobiont' 232]
MPRASIHKKQSELNEEAAKATAQSGLYDWAVTMCFYSALHYVEAYAKHNGVNIGQEYIQFKTQHERRWFFVQDIDYDLGFNDSLINNYDKLYQGSILARYLKEYQTITAREYFKSIYIDYLDALETIKNKLGSF